MYKHFKVRRVFMAISKIKATFSLTSTVVEQLKECSQKEGLNMSTIVILALNDYFKKKGVR